MKKLLAACLCLGLTVSMTGCSLGQLVDKVVSLTRPKQDFIAESKPRVYMDEMKGTLVDFTGNMLTINSNEQNYTFDISQATLECSEGLLTGEEISLIYEGQITDETVDTNSLKPLKVVDDFHNKLPLEEKVLQGQLQNLTRNTISIACSDGTTAVLPITGREMYFTSGIKKDAPVYVHYYGSLSADSAENPNLLSGRNIKVMSVSDTDPFEAPKAVPIKKGTKADKVHVLLQDVDLNTLTVYLDEKGISLNLDMSSIPCYFPGGVVPGAYLHFIYTGTFDGESLNGIQVLCILGDHPDNMREQDFAFRATGTIFAKTANTITIRTSDEAVLTFSTTNAKISASGGLEIGDGVRVIFHPQESKNTNIYHSIRIEDAD